MNAQCTSGRPTGSSVPQYLQLNMPEKGVQQHTIHSCDNQTTEMNNANKSVPVDENTIVSK